MAIEAGAVYLDVVFDEGRIKTQLVRAVDQAARAADGRLRQGLGGAAGAAGELTESLRASGAAAEEASRKARASADRIKREMTNAAGGPERLTEEMRTAIDAAERLARQAEVDAERIRRAMLRAGQGVDDLREDLDDAGRGAGDLGDEIDKIDWGSLAGAGALATLTVGMEGAVTTMGRLRAQMGQTAEESGDLEGVVRQVYGANFAESMGQASDAVVQVHQSLGLVDDGLSQAVQDIFAVSDAFDVAGADSQVLTEGLRAMQNLWPETDAAEALDLITASFQMGTGSAGDLQDTLTEYPRVFAEIGLSAGDMFDFFDTGMQNNAFNTDVLADSVKEMGLLVKEEGSTAQIAIRSIFPPSEAERLIDDFSRGGEAGRTAFYDIIEGISGASSEQDRFNQILQIFGGVGGDNANTLAAMFPELIANRDATREAADATATLDEQYVGLGATLGTFKRQLETSLFEPLGQIAPVAGEFLLVGSSATTAAVAMIAAGGGMAASWAKVTAAAVTAKTAILSVNTVAFLGAGVAIGFIVNELFKAKAAARELADELALAAGDNPADQLAAYTAELERQQRLRGDALTRIGDAFFSPGETRAEIAAIEQMGSSIAVLRAEVVEAAYAGQTFSTHQDALNHYLDEGYDLTTALTAAQAEMVQLTGLASMGTDGWTQRLIANHAAAAETLTATEAFANGVASAGAASMGAAIALHSATEATLAQQAAFDGVAEFFLGMIDPIGAYDAALALNTEEMQAWAQGQADQTADASDSWADHATNVDTTLADINQALLDQQAASVDWADNLQTVAARVPTEFLPELNRIATESPEILAAMRGATDEELAQFVGLATPAGTQFVDELELALAQMPEIGRRFGQETADGLTERLASGLSTAAEISHAYQRSLVTNINPLLLAIGRDEIPLAGINGIGGNTEFLNTGGQVPGGYGSYDDVPATLTRGEVVQQVPAVRKWGPGNLLDLNEGRVPPGWTIPGFNAGGVVGPNIDKLHPEFVRRMQLWSAAQGQPYRFTSGWRSREQQQRLYEKYLNGTGNLAAPPGSSNHEFGLATDGVHWGGRNPGAFGLGYYVNGEPWHLEPTNARSMRGGGGGSAGAPAGASFLSLPPVPTHQFPTDMAVGAALTGSMQKGRDTAQAFIDEQFAFSSIDMTSGLPDQPGGQGAGVEQWTPQVLKALDVVGQPASYAGITKRRMKQESGGNPTVVNRWDSNWVKGTPSVGLMQVIGPTYDAYKHSGYDVGPYSYGTSVNPLANILASMRYALSRYKSLPAAYNKSGGYNAGGLVNPHVRDRGGPLLPGLTLNGTGGPEHVVDPTGPLDVNVIGWSSTIAAPPGNPLRAPEPNVRPFLPTPELRPFDADMMINRLVEALEAGDPIGRLVDIVAGLTTSAAEAAGFVDGILGGLGPDSGVIAAVGAGATGVEGITAALAGIEQLQAGWEAEAEAVEAASAHTEAWGEIHAAEAALAAATTEEQAAAQERLSEAIVTVQDMDRVAALALEAAAIEDVVTQLEAELAIAEEKAALDAQIAEEKAALDAEIAGNREALRVEELTSSQRLVEVQAEMAALEAEGLRHTDAWVDLLREAEGLQGDIADSAADVAAEIERQADAQREAAREARQQAKEAREAARRAAEETAKSSRAEADRLRSELDALLDQRDRLNAQAASATAAYVVAVADAQKRAATDILALQKARDDALFGAFGGIANRFEAGWGNTVGQLTGNIQAQVGLFDEWADGMAVLRRRGVSEDIVASLGLDDPASLAQVRMLLAATGADLAQLDAVLAARRAQTAGQVAAESDALLGALSTAITAAQETLTTTLLDLHTNLTAELAAIAAETALIGMDTGRSYVESITEALKSGLPGVIAAALKVQNAFRDAQEADAALDALSSGRPSVRPVMPSIGVGAGARRGHYVRGGGNYDTGGRVPPGDWLVRNATASDEWIFRDDQLQALVASAGAPAGTTVEALPREITLVVEGTRMRAFVEDTARGAIRQDTRTSAGQGRMS